MTPLITVVTPTNSLKWISLAKDSMTRQSLKDWEWIIVVNGTCSINKVRQLMADDERIHILAYSEPDIILKTKKDNTVFVGAIKDFGSKHATADLILEFDHDDELSFDCLEEVVKAFDDNPEAVFVFSDVVRYNAKGELDAKWKQGGWTYREDIWSPTPDVQIVVEVSEQPPLIPQNVSRIWYAPDHVRAWRKDVYVKIGGHNRALEVCDDLDLMCKLFKEGPFHHIQKVLYRYNVHGENTWLRKQKLVQDLVWVVHDRHIEEMAAVHAKRTEKLAVDLGGGISPPSGWKTLDKQNADIVANLDENWPFEDNSAAAFRAHDILEHLKDPIHVMNEAYRCLEHGGLFLIEVPSTDGRGAFQDPTHISFWNTNSFWYYTNAHGTQRYIKHAGINCKFQVVREYNYFPTEWHKLHEIVYAKVHLAAIKDGPRLHGDINFKDEPAQLP